jgi:F-type H+-transporting ATPase subunit b
MKRLSGVVTLCLLALSLCATTPAFAEGDSHGSDATEGHGEAPPAEHGGGHGEHVPSFHDVNWYYGFLGEKADVEPDLLWRPKGMPVPFGALALNAAILYFLLFKYGRKPISDGLRQRKLGIMKGIEDAARMKAQAEERLAEYQKKLDEVDQEVARIRREMKESGQAERARILSEAKERRARMERDARTLMEQELKAARESLLRDTVRAAVKSAEVTLTAQIGDADQQRLAQEYLASVKAAGGALRGRL